MSDSHSDQELLRQYCRHDSEAAFRALVERHVDLVYGAAFRQLNNRATAEEITQTVFVTLVSRAASLDGHPSLAGWLYHAAVNQARQQFRGEQRRRLREETAVQLETTMQTNEPPALASDLDEALLLLHADDREALVLRFFKQMPLDEVGAELGVDGDAARKRVARAVEKLRQIFEKRGIAFSVVALTAALSVPAATAAPVGLAAAVTAAAAALKGTAVTASTSTIMKGTLVAWTKLKTAAVIGAGLFLTAGITLVAVKISAASRFTPVSSWPGNGNADDPKGGNNGRMMNGASFEPGKIGRAFSLNGDNQYVEIPNGPGLNPAGSFSIVAWIHPMPGSGFRVILGKWSDSGGNQGQHSYIFCLRPDNTLNFGISDAAHQIDSEYHACISQTPVAPDTWSHVAAVYDHDTGTRRVYINGEQVAERTDPPITVFDANNQLGIGARLDSGTGAEDFFAGKINEPAFYDRPLTAAQIRALYQAAK